MLIVLVKREITNLPEWSSRIRVALRGCTVSEEVLSAKCIAAVRAVRYGEVSSAEISL